MPTRLISAVALLAISSLPLAAQAKPDVKQAGSESVTWASLAGDWVGKSYRADKSAITDVTWSFGADKKVWYKFPNRAPEAGKLVAMGGDSVVVEATYKSVTRPDHTVTTTTTGHVKNHKMTGTFHSKFDDGATLDGTVEAAHQIK